MDELWRKYLRGTRRLRGLRLALLIRLAGGRVGRRLSVDRRVHLRHAPHRGWQLGDDVYIGCGVVLDVPAGGVFEIGNNVKIMAYCVVGAAEKVSLGQNCQIAEFSSIRDGNHDTRPGVDMTEAPQLTKPVTVGAGAWIARGCAVIAGSNVGSGAVVGANSVVRGEVAPDSIVAGVPARLIRLR